jgi:hydroxyethylthiazole kinase-like uncharacterized protein yjeF
MSNQYLKSVPLVEVTVEQAITGEQMRWVDRIAAEEFGILSRQLIEVAGFQVARFARMVLGGVKGKRVLVAAGPGNNGADALASIRYLINWGAAVTAVAPGKLNLPGMEYWRIAQNLKSATAQKIPRGLTPDVILDGLFGISLQGDVREPYRQIIKDVAFLKCPVLAVDLPSGLHAELGIPHGIAVKADDTLSLGYPKKGVLTQEAKEYVGNVYVADIGIPPQVIEVVMQKKPMELFGRQSIVRLK